MSESAKKVLYGILIAVVFAISLTLVIIGQRNVGVIGLCTMLIGLGGLVFLLWLYNRKYK